MGFFDMFKKPQKQTTPTSGLNFTVTVSTPKPPTQAELDEQVIPVETRIRTAIASKQGLFPHEILVLDYAHSFYTSGNSFQGFWWYKYGVRDVQAILTSLVQRGFLQIGDLRAALNKQTAAAIKEVLKAHELKQTGKKDDLVQRALDEVSEDELNRLFPKRTYSLTESGKAALEEEAYVSYIHRHMIEYLDIWSLNQKVHTQPFMPYRDKLWGYLNQQSMKHFSDRNFGLYRNCRFQMAQFLKEEKKIKDSLAMLAEVVFHDLSGVSNNYDPQFLEIYAEGFFPYENSHAATAPGIIAAIVDCQKELEYSDAELAAALIERMSKLSVPIQLFSVEDCAKIVLLERDQDTDALKSIYAKAKRAFKQKYPGIKI
jgi:hypothetical protein